jgi:CheY-like chemotaxis protein/HPt (histidine-containing phosphotransfer) domain-containing protein
MGYSDNPGGGSVFWLELPLGTSTASYPVAAANPVGLAGEVDPAPVQALHALVVDDMAMNRDIASTLLRIAGYKVDCVDSGEAAVAAVAATDFDVVLMDVGMPEMDGLEATRRIRALSGSRGSVPIVALTAHAFKEQVEECRKAGMDGHLTKPFDGNTLVAAVTAAAGHQREPGQLAAAPPTIVPVAHEAIGSELPVLDPPAFERTAAFLAPGMVAAYLRVIEARGEAILRDLHEPDALIRNRNELAKAAHTLAGSVIMFGFGRLAAIGLRFEKAVQSDATELPAIVEALSAAVEATLLEIRTRLPREASA